MNTKDMGERMVPSVEKEKEEIEAEAEAAAAAAAAAEEEAPSATEEAAAEEEAPSAAEEEAAPSAAEEAAAEEEAPSAAEEAAAEEAPSAAEEAAAEEAAPSAAEEVPSAEEEAMEEEEEEEDDDVGDEEQEDGNDEEPEGRDDKEKEDKAIPQSADKTENKIPLPVQPKEKKQAQGLNLNNEVVKMRKEVKRVRALIIRKLTRQIGALKKKKGKDMEVERNQRRAARLLEEIHAMKGLLPDLVTKTALQKNLNFEQVCKDPKSTISNRAVARIATHPQFNKKIEDIKAAVKAFKEERMKGGKQGGKEKAQSKAVKATPQSPDKKVGRQHEEGEEDITVEQKEIMDNEEGDGIPHDTKDATVAEPVKEAGKATHSADTADAQRKEIQESRNARPASIKRSEAKDIAINKPQSKDVEKNPDLRSAPEVLQEEESDTAASDDEEKEYFDDSTEERFHKQSSQSESDDDDDFFVGKVSRFKKKKKQKSVDGEKRAKGDPTDQIQAELGALEPGLKSKATSLQSVFCPSLSKPGGRGGAGRGRGRGGDTFRGQGKPKGGSGPNRDFSKQSEFQKQKKGTERNSGSKGSKPFPEGRHPEATKRDFPSVGRGRGRGRGDVRRQNDRRDVGVFSHQAPQQALHPSWEASKKRKEQQGQILAFQGKKIKFDDDD